MGTFDDVKPSGGTLPGGFILDGAPPLPAFAMTWAMRMMRFELCRADGGFFPGNKVRDPADFLPTLEAWELTWLHGKN